LYIREISFFVWNSSLLLTISFLAAAVRGVKMGPESSSGGGGGGMSSGGGGMFSVNFILPLPLSFGGLPPSASLAMKASSRVQRYNLADEVLLPVCHQTSS
jgi:hypothetical protein